MTGVVLEEFFLRLQTGKHAEDALVRVTWSITEILRAILILFILIDNLQCRAFWSQLAKRFLIGNGITALRESAHGLLRLISSLVLILTILRS